VVSDYNPDNWVVIKIDGFAVYKKDCDYDVPEIRES
jgi:hypothetical protein